MPVTASSRPPAPRFHEDKLRRGGGEEAAGSSCEELTSPPPLYRLVKVAITPVVRDYPVAARGKREVKLYVRDQPEKSFSQRVLENIRNYIITGILILIPVAITYVLVRWAFYTVDGLLRPLFDSLLGWNIPGLGLIGILLAAYTLGLVSNQQIGRRAIRASQEFILQVPVIGAVYGPAKKLIESFTKDSGAGFSRVVVAEYPKAGTWMVGFLTGFTRLDSVAYVGVIYVPTAPTPNSGWVAMVPVESIFDTTMSVQEAMSMVLSGGISSPLNIDLQHIDPQEAIEFLDKAEAEAALQAQ